MRNFLSFLLVGISICLAGTALADGQKHFQTLKLGDRTKFQYVYFDYKHEPINLSFILPNDELEKGLTQFRPYSNEEANQFIMSRVRQYVNTLKGVKVSIQETANGLNISATGDSESQVREAIRNIEKINTLAQKEYLKQNYFLEDTQGKYVFPDHARIAAEFVQTMRPVAQALRSQTAGLGMRETINYALNFVQSIPYDTLLQRTTANGAGFATPPGLLAMNKGDCDTKSVALAAILKNLFPRLRMMIVYVPGHAFVGFNMPPQKGDRTLQIGGSTFVLAEPAGPGIFAMGKIAPDSEKLLQQNSYSYREIL